MSVLGLRQWYENLDEVSVLDINNYYAKDCFFKDPFNELKGSDKIEKIFVHMFKELERPRFDFIDLIDNGEQSFLSWDFKFIRNGKPFVIHGTSHLKWSNEKVVYHRDYWDVGEELLLKIPLVKNVYGALVRKLSVE